jgi:hypothetical protein
MREVDLFRGPVRAGIPRRLNRTRVELPAVIEFCVIITYTDVMAVANPFVYGEVVTSAAFADREEERDRLARDLGEGQKVFLISPRRYGKSSLIRDVMKRLAARRVLTVEVTVAASSSYVGFLEAYARALLSADTPVSAFRRWAAELLAAVHRHHRYVHPPLHSVTAPRSSAAAGSTSGTAWRADEIFALPARIADARGQRLAIALDEFQAITAFDDANVEQALRAAVQQQRSVVYVFAGSEPSLMERMITARRPFYKAGPVVRLGKIDERTFAAHRDEVRAERIRPEDAGSGPPSCELRRERPRRAALAHEHGTREAIGRKYGDPR